MNKLYDNGLNEEQQAHVDAMYEDQMRKISILDPKLYKRLRDLELPGFVLDKKNIKNDDDQFELNL